MFFTGREGAQGDDEDEDGVPQCVSDSESESENDCVYIFVSCDTEGISFVFIYFIFNIIFIFYLHIFVYILSSELVKTDTTRSSLKPVFFFLTLLFSRCLLCKQNTKKKSYRTCGCAVNLPHNRTCGVSSLIPTPTFLTFTYTRTFC